MTVQESPPVKPLWIVSALTLIWLAATGWARPLMLPDEGRYVGVAWEMLRSGDWLTPTLNGLPYFHKPPLFYWLTAGSMSAFGTNEWAARAAPLTGAWLAAMAVYLFVQRWIGPLAARWTLLALLVQPLLYNGAQFANLDMLVAGCITVTTLLLAHAALAFESGLPARGTLVAAYASAALGVLAKGLIGFVIPGLTIVVWLVLRRRWPSLKALIWWPGGLIFLAVAAPWFLAMQWRFPEFLNYFFVVQHFKRFAAGGFNNVQPFWFYPAVLLVFSLPWLPWLAQKFTRGFFGNDPVTPARGAVRLLMVVWLSAAVLFFSLPQSKLLGYILPAVPPLAFLIADGRSGHSALSARAVRLWWFSFAISAAASVGAVAVLALRPLPSSLSAATALAAQRGTGEPVFMLDHYFFDLPVYGKLREPVYVVDEWNDPEISKRDNWRKELIDAAGFASADAAARLIVPASLPAALCKARISWLVGMPEAAKIYPLLATARIVSEHGDITLWRLDRDHPALAAALQCSGKPNDGS